jgi:hypothetical protein
MNVINTYLVNIVKQKEWYTNRILNPTQVTSFMLHLTKQITNCGFDIHLQYVSFIYSKLMCTYVSSQRGDNSCSCQYLSGSAIFWESLVWLPTWDGNLLRVTNLSIAFTHGGVDQPSTQSAFFVTLCLKSGDLGFIYKHHNPPSINNLLIAFSQLFDIN